MPLKRSSKSIQDNWQVEPLTRKHVRDRFDCGDPALNTFLRTQARQQQEKNLGRTFVVASPGEPNKVLGFYTLSAGSIQFESLPMGIRKKLPRYPIPVAMLGRLAVDLSMKGQGLGGYLLWHALNKSAQIASEQMGLVAVVVDAKNDEAKSFYEKYGFAPLQGRTHTLCIPIETILSALP